MKPSLSRHVLALVISCSHWALAAEPRAAPRPLAGIRIWNRFPAKNVMLEQGLVCFSDQPFSSTDAASLTDKQPIDPIVLTEAPGYPTAFPVKVSARYIRLVSTAPGSVGLGEIEVIANTK